ncbi:MAG TPA: hypothetical protein VFG04_05830 [Planctomycetaceae bacterium]|nr:hypothetical protein [Planctomycetaceae bacterium]
MTHRDLRILFAACLACLATLPAAAQDRVAPTVRSTSERAASDRPVSERAGQPPATAPRAGLEAPTSPRTRRTPAFPWSARQSEESAAAAADDAVQLAPRAGDLIRLGTKDGQTEWSIWGETYEKFVEFLRTQNGAGRSDPDYSISSIAIQGAEEGDWAKLKAKFTIQVDRPDVRVTVPVGLQEGSVAQGIKHTGPGEFRAADSLNRQKSHSVFLRGKGLHEVTIPFVVPIRRQLNQRHLQLTIPPAAGSEITLRVAKEHCQAKPIDEASVHATSIPNGTLIEAVGIKGTFDLAWETPLDESHARPVFDVFSKCSVAMDRDRIQWSVLQTIEAKQGNLSSVRVRVPRNFSRISGQQLYVSEVRKYGLPDIDPTGFIKVDLKAASTGRIELRWDVEGAPPANGLLSLSGFDVEGARSDSGDVSITPTEGFHFDYRGGNNIRRINVSTLGAGLAESAYAIWQPFRLDLALEEIRPQFLVEPAYFLLLAQQRIELTVQLRIHVRQGALRELKFSWPEWKKQGWTLEQLPEFTELIESEKSADHAPPTGNAPRDDSQLQLRLNGRHGDDFVVAFRASRSAPGSATSFPLSLPQLAGSSMTGGVLVAADAENIKSSLEPRAETVVRLISPEKREAIGPPESFRGLQQVVMRIDSPKAAFDATVTTQPQKIETESRAKIEVRAGRLQVEQRISYRVSYERLSEATLVLPKELRRANVQFTVDRPDLEAKIEPSWTSGESDAVEIARIPLPPQPRIGAFDLYAHYSVRMPEPPSQAAEIPIPLVRSRDNAFKTLRVELRAPDDSEFEVVDEAWIPSLAIDKGSTYAWTAKGEQTNLPLRLVRVTALASPGVKISRALIRSTLDMTGTAQTTAQYRIQGPVSRLALTLPAGSTEPKFLLDRLPLKLERIREARPNSGEYLLDIGALSPEPLPVLTVQYGDPEASPCGLMGSHRLSAPVFPDNTTIESTVWEVTVPFEQFLFSVPSGYSPEFRWQRDVAVWDRQPTAKAADLGRWLGGAARSTVDEGNAYAFSRFGAARTITVGSMAGSFVIFVGAGLSLVAAFILLRVRVARNLLTLFVFAFTVAIFCLWYGEAVRLLLQPALLGFLFALVAAAVDSRLQRRRGHLLLEPPGAAEFVTVATSPSSIERNLVPIADPEAPTINRLANQDGSHGSQAVSASASGSHP